MTKKKTHEEYVAELAEKNPNVEVIGEYVNAKTKIEHHCLIHDVYWSARPTNVLNGRGCPECGNEKISLANGMSHEQYIEKLNMANPNVVAIDRYINSRIPILHRCLIHNIEWCISPSNALEGQGCCECRKQKIGNSLRKTPEQYVEELRLINHDIVALEDYVDASTPILHKCLKDGYEWYTSPHSVLKGNGCPRCANRIRRTHDEYVRDVMRVNKEIEVLGLFVDVHTSILHKCLICGYEWNCKPHNILLGTGCPKCFGNIKKSHSEYVCEVSQINPGIEVVGVYVNAKTPILHRCKIDECEWMAAPTNVLNGRGCPQCSESNGERCIRLWLDKHDIGYVTQMVFKDCKDKKPMPFDFYLPEYNVCIEYQGEQHYRSIDYFGGQKIFEYIQRHDKMKAEYCKDNNIKLLSIPYYSNVDEELNNFLFI